MKKIYILPDGSKINLFKIKSIGDLISVKSQSLTSLGY